MSFEFIKPYLLAAIYLTLTAYNNILEHIDVFSVTHQGDAYKREMVEKAIAYNHWMLFCYAFLDFLLMAEV